MKKKPKKVIPDGVLNFMQCHPILLLNTMDKENIPSVQEEGIPICHQLIFLLHQPFLVNYPLTQLLNCDCLKSWTSTYGSLMFYFTTLLVCLDINTPKNLALQILYQINLSNHSISSLNRLFILIPCPRNACSIFHESILAKLFSSAKFMFLDFLPSLLHKGYLSQIQPLKWIMFNISFANRLWQHHQSVYNITILTADCCRYTQD